MQNLHKKNSRQRRSISVRKPKSTQNQVSTPSEEEPIVLLEGQIAIQAALETGSRTVHEVLIRRFQSQSHRQNHTAAKIKKIAQQTGTVVTYLDKDRFTKKVRQYQSQSAESNSHGGIMALAGPRHFVSLDRLLEPDQTPFIVMLDGIEDPFNFGHTVRALYAAGMTGLVLRERNWMTATNVVIRASAGATELVTTAVADSVEQAVAFFREQGCAILCTGMGEDERIVSLYEADLAQPIFLLVGGEKRGVTRSFMAQADQLLQIPYGPQSDNPFKHSLGTTAAAAVLGFEVMRQRNLGAGTS